MHFAQFYTTKCSSLTGGYAVPELTSSGLTHSAKSQFKCPTELLEFFTPDFWQTSSIVNEMNYGIIDIVKREEKRDVEIDLKIYNKEGKEKISKKLFKIKDLTIMNSVLPSKMCEQVHSLGALAI